MKKRLLVIFSILIIVAVIVVLGSTLFTLQSAEISLYDEEGYEILDTSGVMPSDLIADFAGKNIFFLPESELADSIHSKQEFSSWQVVGIEKNFPNSVRIHLTKRLKIFYLSKGGIDYAVDVNGYVVGLAQGDTSRYINISQFSENLKDITLATELQWENEAAEKNFEAIKILAETIWQFNFNYDEIWTLLGSYQISENALALNTRTGAKIVIAEPYSGLHEKLVSAYGVYSNKNIDMTGSGVIITVYKDGSVKTTNDN